MLIILGPKTINKIRAVFLLVILLLFAIVAALALGTNAIEITSENGKYIYSNSSWMRPMLLLLGFLMLVGGVVFLKSNGGIITSWKNNFTSGRYNSWGMTFIGLIMLFGSFTPEKPVILDPDGFSFQTGNMFSRKQHEFHFKDIKTIDVDTMQSPENKAHIELRIRNYSGEVNYIDTNNLINAALPEIIVFALASGVVVNDSR